jgi:hypothetical protein
VTLTLDQPAQLALMAGPALRLVDTIWRLRLEPEPAPVATEPVPSLRAIPEAATALRLVASARVRPDAAPALRLELNGWRLRLEPDTVTTDDTRDARRLTLTGGAR